MLRKKTCWAGSRRTTARVGRPETGGGLVLGEGAQSDMCVAKVRLARGWTWENFHRLSTTRNVILEQITPTNSSYGGWLSGPFFNTLLSLAEHSYSPSMATPPPNEQRKIFKNDECKIQNGHSWLDRLGSGRIFPSIPANHS